MKIITDIKKLKEKSKDVESIEEAKELLQKLKKHLPETGIGLSAIQLGINKKIAYIKHNDREEVLINPILLEEEDRFLHHGEGCLSIPGKYVNVTRYKQITISNLIIDGDEWERKKCVFFTDNINENIIPIAIQHEIDHMNGILMVDKQIISTIKNTKKIGRNEKCPCGSGKKYKNCCIRS